MIVLKMIFKDIFTIVVQHHIEFETKYISVNVINDLC